MRTAALAGLLAALAFGVPAASGGTEPVRYWSPAWSLANLDGSNVRQLTHDNLGKTGVSFSARWSPNGRRILFENRGRLFVMNADGSNVRDVTPG